MRRALLLSVGRCASWLCRVLAAVACVCSLTAELSLAAGDDSKKLPPAASRPVDFVRDIQPLLAARCNDCHGADEEQGQLRLDAKAIVMRGGKSGPLLAPGKSEESLLIKRLVGIGGKQMPLEDEPLSKAEIGLIRAWIDQGAKWPDGVGSAATEVKKHWAYLPPVAPPLPEARDSEWAENAIDRFVLARLEKEKIAPSRPIDRQRFIRRASLDLLGLPPSVAEVDAFVADTSPDAHERLLDRLLASPAYGERWATAWLDAARYADSNGYQRDGHRTIWPYRDWVIRALNADLPFDRFTIEQLAGDLLPGATLEQQIATGFHRCTTVSVEAGTDEEENRVNQVIDRVNVTGTVWLGTTLECCQCHDHKYDPFTQRDYYRLFAFFNNSPKETYPRSPGSAALEFGGPEAELPPEGAMVERRGEVDRRRERVAAELEQCLSDEAAGLSAWLANATASEEKQQKLPANIRKLLAVRGKRNKNQEAALRKYFITQNPAAKRMQAELDELQKQSDRLAPPKTLVMSEMKEPRTTNILVRGNFLSPGEGVEPGTPRILPPLSAGAPPTRLGLAEWLVSRDNPLTARVQANRAWAQFFGRGLVASEEDFGTQAEPPTHPELLDWLAVAFMGDDFTWSMKRLHRHIVTSATYRQSSNWRTDLAHRDPDNRLLARGPRFRLPAEFIRDNALAASGLLTTKMHGEPVYPLQPEGIWRVTGQVDNNYRVSGGGDAWRRGVYTVWRRSAPYPSFLNFDAPDRSACTVKRPRSNTPLQALTLENDPVYVELAHGLADRVLREAADRPLADKLIFAFRTVLTRPPNGEELAALLTAFEEALARYEADPAAAGRVAEANESSAGSVAERAAWFNVAQILLNLDEAITKN